MGFFGKIKDNFQHGSVKVQLQAAQSVSKQEPTLPVTVTLTNGPEEARNIKGVTVSVVATAYTTNQNNAGIAGFQIGNASSPVNNTGNDTSTAYTIASVSNNEAFVLQPGETKPVVLSIVVNNGAQQPAPTDGILGHLASLMSSDTRYTYNLVASADVEGIALDPSASQTLQLL